MRPFRLEAEMKSHPISSAEPWDVRQRVAVVLLQHAGTDTVRRPNLSQREMAAMLGTSWDMVNNSLKSLQAEGAIRIDRHRIVINKKALEQITMEKGFKYQKSEVKSWRHAMKARAYILLRIRDGDLEQAAAIVRRQPGVVIADQVEGLADVIFAVQAPDRESLTELTVQAIAAVEAVTEDMQLLPVKEEAASG